MPSYTPLSPILAEPRFFERIAQLTVRLTDDLGMSDVCIQLSEAARTFGCDAAAFATFVHDDEAFDSYRAILACDPIWCLEYESRAGYMDDPWLEYAQHSAEAALTQRIEARTPKQQEIINLARKFGFRSGLVIPVHAPKGLSRIGALCIGSSTEGHFNAATLPSAAYAATGLAFRLHGWQAAQLRNELLAGERLTPEELKLLSMERDGRRSKEVAKVLGITSLSIDSRWQRLNAKLGVTSRVTAARIAAEYGLI